MDAIGYGTGIYRPVLLAAAALYMSFGQDPKTVFVIILFLVFSFCLFSLFLISKLPFLHNLPGRKGLVWISELRRLHIMLLALVAGVR